MPTLGAKVAGAVEIPAYLVQVLVVVVEARQ